MHIQKFTFNPFQENTYVLSDDKMNAVIVDPGCYEREEEMELQSYIEDNNLKVVALLNTHAHVDHVLGNQFVLHTYKVPFYLHELDLPILQSVENYAHVYGMGNYKVSPKPTNILKGGESLEFGDLKMKVLHTPGHCPGHVVYYLENEKVVVNGDVLFRGSFGRTDLPGGSMEILKKTIFDIMFELPEDTKVLSGHGDDTTIGVEKRTNYIHNF
jgi:glyoxylase-like metal-dependent hydrolase (beta-lactamase superfamily II)